MLGFIQSSSFLLLVLASQSGPAQNRSMPAKIALVPYTSCTFADGLKIVALDPLASGVTYRTVPTGGGEKRIEIEARVRVMFAYPDTDFYANVKVESLPAATYEDEKKALLDNWQYTHMTSAGTTLNYGLASPLDGFEIHGFDRDKLEGGVLGLYLMFDDSQHVVTTFYLLNQDPATRSFKTIDEYRKRRDRFLPSYTSCIRANQKRQP